MTPRQRRALQAELVGVRARIAEARAKIPDFARISLVAYHQALDIARMQETELDAIERQLAAGTAWRRRAKGAHGSFISGAGRRTI